MEALNANNEPAASSQSGEAGEPSQPSAELEAYSQHERQEPDIRRVTIKLTDEAYSDLKKLATERGLTITGLIKRALATDRFFWEHRRDRLLLKQPNGSTREVVLLQDA